MDLGYLMNYADDIFFIINRLFVPILIAIAFLTFLWGVYNYFILGAADPDKRSEGRGFVLWGIIGFVVIFSVWGLVAIVGNTLGLGPGGLGPPTPTLGAPS